MNIRTENGGESTPFQVPFASQVGVIREASHPDGRENIGAAASYTLAARRKQFPSNPHFPMTICKTILTALTLGLALGFAGPVSAAITVLHTWNLDGAAAGQPASDPAVDSIATINLGKVGSFNHVNTSNAGVGVALTNGSPNTASNPATTYYHSATGQVALTSTSNWGFEAWVKMNSAGGEGSVLMIGSEAGGVILQELGVLGNGWAIHIAGTYLAGTASSTVKVGQEQHIAGVIENGQWTIYVDGVAEAFQDIYAGGNQVITPTAGMWVGASTNGGNPVRGMDGDIGVVRIFEFEAGTFNINQTLFIPEPASLTLMGMGSLLMLRRRRA
jgi:hypothetical protein